MPALTRCRSPCAVTPPDGCWLLTVPRAAGSDQTKGCNERGQCLAASKKFFLPRFSNLSSHSCFKSLMLLLDTYSSFVLCFFVRLVGFYYYYYYWRGICALSYLQVWFCFQFSSLASSVLGNVISAQLILFTQFTWHTHTNSHSYLGHLANCRLYTYIKWYFLPMICLEHWYNYCKKNHNIFIIH